jgi:kynureninase
MKIDADAQDANPVTLAAARAEFDADVTYLDTATFGLAPRRSWAALQQALAQWRADTTDAVAYDLPLAAARSSYAHLAGEPGLDLAAWAHELADLFDHAASIGPPGAGRTETT